MREDFVDAIKRVVPEHFLGDNVKNRELILALAEQLYSDREELYLGRRCDEYELPCFDIPCDVHTYE